MFKFDRSENRLVALEEPTFAELDVRERDHLQEWLARTPNALGEELLIIQKEFDGFDGTRERLDLLALDQEGRLVVIENKLDSGRDVVWQALKYVAYCSSLKKTEIVEIYQRYLDRWSDSANAVTMLCEFFGEEDLDDVVLNAGNEQRLVLVATNFRKEVTTPVLWLLGHGVRAQCFRVVPYRFGEEVLIDVHQIIPTPEAADYMIDVAVKESEEKWVQGTKRRQQAFWKAALEELHTRKASRFQNIRPSTNHWLTCATGVSGCTYQLIFLKKEVRVDLYFQRPKKKDNEWIFDQLEQDKQALEEQFNDNLQWHRKEKDKSCKISYSRSFDGYNREKWPDMIRWLCDHFIKFEDTFSKPLEHLNRKLKSGSDTSTLPDNYSTVGSQS